MQKEQEQQEQEKQEKRPQPTRYRSEMPLDQLMPSPENARRRFEDGPLRDLADSIRAWPDQVGLARLLREAGWTHVAYRNLSGGIVALHRGRRP